MHMHTNKCTSIWLDLYDTMCVYMFCQVHHYHIFLCDTCLSKFSIKQAPFQHAQPRNKKGHPTHSRATPTCMLKVIGQLYATWTAWMPKKIGLATLQTYIYHNLDIAKASLEQYQYKILFGYPKGRSGSIYIE